MFYFPVAQKKTNSPQTTTRTKIHPSEKKNEKKIRRKSEFQFLRDNCLFNGRWVNCHLLCDGFVCVSLDLFTFYFSNIFLPLLSIFLQMFSIFTKMHFSCHLIRTFTLNYGSHVGYNICSATFPIFLHFSRIPYKNSDLPFFLRRLLHLNSICVHICVFLFILLYLRTAIFMFILE